MQNEYFIFLEKTMDLIVEIIFANKTTDSQYNYGIYTVEIPVRRLWIQAQLNFNKSILVTVQCKQGHTSHELLDASTGIDFGCHGVRTFINADFAPQKKCAVWHLDICQFQKYVPKCINTLIIHYVLKLRQNDNLRR